MKAKKTKSSYIQAVGFKDGHLYIVMSGKACKRPATEADYDRLIGNGADDHSVGKTWHGMNRSLEGQNEKLDEMPEALAALFGEEKSAA